MLETEVLFQLVVVGSSAGGIEALSKLVASLPIPFSVPLVIAQHLDPARLSHLAEILTRHTTLPIVSVEQQETLKPGTIYVVPSNHHVEITDQYVSLLPDGDGRPTPSVNLLLSSAADIYSDRLIAVILTGTGSDGTAGARAVHDRGGTVIIQNPETAAYPSMPQSLDPATVDFVADLSEIGAILTDLVSGKNLALHQINSSSQLEPILNQVRDYTGVDFTGYKPATILRRLQRRLLATGSSNLANYRDYLKENPNEYEQLEASFLIKVTEFMRDPELFSYLQKQILPQLINYSRLHNNYELRFWSAGCATGEEAYSLAILLFELLGNELTQFSIKIFATDLDSEAIAFARRGLYSAKSLAKLPPELVERYFDSKLANTSYEIKKQVRNLLVFGEHDLGQRAPFPRIDMVLCRNVLIYFNRELQEHALKLFAFALRDEGYLVLGRTETVNPLTEFFDLQEPQQRIYVRQGVRRLNPPFGLKNMQTSHLPLAKSANKQKVQQTVHERLLAQVQQEAHYTRLSRENLLLKLPVGVVIVDSHFDIVEINSAARRLLSIHSAAIGEDFVHLAQHIPPRELSSAITKAIREDVVSNLKLIQVPHLTNGTATFLQLSCYPQPDTKTQEQLGDLFNKNTMQKQALIIITDLTSEVAAKRILEENNVQQTILVKELNQRIFDFQKTNTELQKTNLQLKQTNIEMELVKNLEINQLQEELARVTSELTTTKNKQLETEQGYTYQMELLVEANQSLLEVNKELTSQNAVLRISNEEYSLHTEEAQAAIEEADTLNEEMQATNEELETLNEELQATVEELNTTNSDLVVQGEALRKLTEELRSQQQNSEQEKVQLTTILTSMADSLVVVDTNNKILLTNNAYEELQKLMEGQVLLDVNGDKALVIDNFPLTRAAKGESFNLTFSFRTTFGHRHWIEAIGQPVRGGNGEDRSVIVMRDITERNLRRLQEQFLSLVGHELRTPLTVSKGYTQRAEHWLRQQKGDFEKPLHNLTEALRQMEILQHLLDDLVDVNRLQNGKFNISFEPVNLSALLTQVVEDSQLNTNKSLVIEAESEADSLWVNGSAIRLQQVLTNLINNAITHAPTSPKITLSLRKLVDKEQVEIKVQDYGVGIKAEHLAEIFGQFYQVGQGNSNHKSGLGLGLFICQQIVVAHGGNISAKSVEGEGTQFIIQLPLIGVE